MRTGDASLFEGVSPDYEVRHAQRWCTAGTTWTSKLHMIDLAGSERISRSGAAGDRLKVGVLVPRSCPLTAPAPWQTHVAQPCMPRGKELGAASKQPIPQVQHLISAFWVARTDCRKLLPSTAAFHHLETWWPHCSGVVYTSPTETVR